MKRWTIAVLTAVTAFMLAACERPDPNTVAAAVPESVLTEFTPVEPTATAGPIQVNVTILMPTALAAEQIPVQVLPESVKVMVITPTPDPTEVAEQTQVEIEPTPYPSNFYMGWTWSDNLVAADTDGMFVRSNGAQLRDQPSPDGTRIGLVVGFAEVLVVGQSYCGYTPVMAQLADMLVMTTPRPDVLQPTSKVEQQPVSPLFAVQMGTTSGWAHASSLIISDNSATAGQFGINLRQEPCEFAANLGFVPAHGIMDILGEANGAYLPVRVSDEVIQLPLSFEPPFQPNPTADFNSIAEPTRQPVDIP